MNTRAILVLFFAPSLDLKVITTGCAGGNDSKLSEKSSTTH